MEGVEIIPFRRSTAALGLCHNGGRCSYDSPPCCSALTDAPGSRRLVHWIALALITLISFLFGSLPAIGGMLQRLLWVVGFAWLVYLGTGEMQAGSVES